MGSLKVWTVGHGTGSLEEILPLLAAELIGVAGRCVRIPALVPPKPMHPGFRRRGTLVDEALRIHQVIRIAR